ncbi:glycine zipper domain-containing protein [Halomonas sp. CKK8]|uniref:glycine zipper domain-containing protein n=1 Tax=Halomonas sp. CKK8 TaxID=3036127 RepID=UPI002414DF6E|nr:glycine zipper domain-containing protein [Halomonas sp. CKK8]WFM72428.1 glycine zipper domain-containing protein [Halomonas sp. CKK8]
MNIVPRILLGVSFLCFGFSVSAQQSIVYPAKGQTATQQASDEAACHAWAKQSTGIDPAVVTQSPTPSSPQAGTTSGSGGERFRGAVRGAAGGALIGEIANDDAGEGAAIGAVVGTMAGGRRARQQQQQMQQQQVQQQQQQTHSQQQQQMDTFSRAYAACMEGRGYTIR